MEPVRARRLKLNAPTVRGRSLSLDERTGSQDNDNCDGVLPSGIAPVDMFIMSRLNDSSSYFFTWFCKRYRIRIGVRDLGGKEEIQRCPICLDACTKSIELQCGHAFCRSCLTTSAANNMTACALCRRKQEINPELLRARFDEQRMLNLAQRLAIPLPVRSRPSASSASMPASTVKGTTEGGAACSLRADEEKLPGDPAVGNTPNVESLTTRGHLLFGPWGDVGAMRTDELRRRWKFSEMQASTSPDAATVGAAPAAELRASWCELQRMMRASVYTGSEHEHASTPLQVSHGSQSRTGAVNCSSESEAHPTVSDSSCAGGSSLEQLSSRWLTLARIPPGGKSVGIRDSEEASRNCCSNLEVKIPVIGVHGVQSTVAKDMLTSSCTWEAAYLDDVGSRSSGALMQRWKQIFRYAADDVGDVEVPELLVRLTLARGHQGVGGLSKASLEARWNASGLEDAERGQDGYGGAPINCDGKKIGTGSAGGDTHGVFELGKDTSGRGMTSTFFVGSDSMAKYDRGSKPVGAESTDALYNRWCAAGDRAAPVG